MATTNNLRKCPFCAEEVKKDALICKHCKSDLSEIVKKENEEKEKARLERRAKEKERNAKLWKFIGWSILAFFITVTFYFSLPIFFIWLIWKKTNLVTKNKWIATAVVCFAYVSFLFYYSYGVKQPSIALAAPENNMTTRERKIAIKGSVEPKDSKFIKVSEMGTNAEMNVPVSNGEFSFDVALDSKQNNFKLELANWGKEASTTVTINREAIGEESVDFSIDSPKNNTAVGTYPVKLTGSVVADSAKVEIDRCFSGVVVKDKKFSCDIEFLLEGNNEINVTVTNEKAAMSDSKVVNIVYSPSAEEKAKRAAEDAEYQAQQEAEKDRKANEELEKFRQERYNAQRERQTFEDLQKIKRELEYQKTRGY